MISFRQQLAKVGITAHQFVSYRSFFLAPPGLREALRSMDFPSHFWEAIPGKEQDKSWTEEIQGCAFAHNRWFYVSNAAGAPRLHVFDGPSGAKVQSWNIQNVPPPNPPLPGFSFHHFGAILIDGDFIYIDHWCDIGGQLMVFKGNGATLDFVKWIPLQNVNGRVGMVAINFAQRMVVTSGGEKNIQQVYLHSLDSGAYTGKSLTLSPGISDGGYAQGGFWSPNNHLFISSGQGGIFDSAKEYQYIYCYSPLSGKRLGTIPVRSAAGRQELEGCSYAHVTREGQQVYFHAVLLENEATAKDDIFLKSFSADRPELI